KQKKCLDKSGKDILWYKTKVLHIGNICFHRRKLKFYTEETSVFPYRNFCFPRKKPFASLLELGRSRERIYQE
ncbi:MULTISPECIES: hypothetical protein, partial [Parabacteroides]